MSRKESTSSGKSIRFSDFKENIINSKEKLSVENNSMSRLQIYHEYNNPSVRFSISSNQEEISKEEAYEDVIELNSLSGRRYFEEYVSNILIIKLKILFIHISVHLIQLYFSYFSNVELSQKKQTAHMIQCRLNWLNLLMKQFKYR